MATLGCQLANQSEERKPLNFRRVVNRGISEIVALAGAARTPSPGFRILIYHAVGSPIKEDRLGLYTISPELFSQHMETLSAYPEIRLCGFLEGFSSTGLGISVTFDDGYKDTLYEAAPILAKHNIPFTVFISTSFVQNRAENYLSPEEVCELAALPGVTIGTHGSTHVPLTQCGDPMLKRELEDSRHYLEDLLGIEIVSMSYPHGAVSRRVRDRVEAAGYRAAGTSLFNINGSQRDSLLLARTDILGIDSVRVFRQKLHGDWDWSRIKGSGKFREEDGL